MTVGESAWGLGRDGPCLSQGPHPSRAAVSAAEGRPVPLQGQPFTWGHSPAPQAPAWVAPTSCARGPPSTALPRSRHQTWFSRIQRKDRWPVSAFVREETYSPAPPAAPLLCCQPGLCHVSHAPAGQRAPEQQAAGEVGRS